MSSRKTSNAAVVESAEAKRIAQLEQELAEARALIPAPVVPVGNAYIKVDFLTEDLSDVEVDFGALTIHSLAWKSKEFSGWLAKRTAEMKSDKITLDDISAEFGTRVRMTIVRAVNDNDDAEDKGVFAKYAAKVGREAKANGARNGNFHSVAG